MNRECNIVKDIISLYVEDMVSRDTRTFIEEHLEHCPECRSELEHIRKPVEFVTDMSAAPINDLKKKLFVRRVQTVLFTTALVLCFCNYDSTAFFSIFPQLSAGHGRAERCADNYL